MKSNLNYLQCVLVKPVAVGPMWLRSASKLLLSRSARTVLSRSCLFPVAAISRFASDEIFRATFFNSLNFDFS